MSRTFADWWDENYQDEPEITRLIVFDAWLASKEEILKLWEKAVTTVEPKENN